ncbi:MAG: peroxiredoxin [Thermoplasmata archaeon]
MIEVGHPAPDFQEKLQDGSSFRLSSLRGKPVVLYFYPKADTPGCTIEAKGFRDHYAEFQKAGVQIVGVSTDDCPDQQAFATKYGLPFALVADHAKKVASAYGVLKPTGTAKRVTFFINPDGTIAEVVDVSGAEQHVERARARYL